MAKGRADRPARHHRPSRSSSRIPRKVSRPKHEVDRARGQHDDLEFNPLRRCSRPTRSLGNHHGEFPVLYPYRCGFPFARSNSEYPRLPHRRIGLGEAISGQAVEDSICPFTRGAQMSKREMKVCLKRPSVPRQHAASRAAAMNKSQPRMVTRSNENPAPTETAGEIFPSGVMLDLIRDAADDKVKLMRSDGPNVSISDSFVLNGRVFIPPTVNDDVMRAINLPSNAADYGSTAALFDDLQRLFRAHPGLSEEAVSKAAFGVLATWFPECAPPLLLVSAPDPSGSRLLLEQLRYACRRSVIIGDVTRGGIWSLPLSLRPTLIIDRPKPTKYF